MSTKTQKDFSYSFTTEQTPLAIFKKLLKVDQWWSNVYGETITGKSDKAGDEFTFTAGGGAHYSVQKLIEAVPGEKIVWLVTKSNLSFLKKKDEWTNTKIQFDIEEKNGKTNVTFTHEGLNPVIECYDACSNGWMQYLKKLEQAVN